MPGKNITASKTILHYSAFINYTLHISNKQIKLDDIAINNLSWHFTDRKVQRPTSERKHSTEIVTHGMFNASIR